MQRGRDIAAGTRRFTKQNVIVGHLNMTHEQLDRAYILAEKKAQRRASQQERCCLCGEKIMGKIWVVDAAKGKWACTHCNNQRPGQ